MNSNGLLLLQLCTEFELAVCNTFYQPQKVIDKITWIYQSKIKARTHLGLYHHSKARPPRCLYCESDAWDRMWYETTNLYVTVKLRMCIMRKVGATGVKVPKRVDVSKLQSSEVCEALRNTFDNNDVGGPWEQFN